MEFGGFVGDAAHLCDEVLEVSVVVDPFLVEGGLFGGESSVDGFAPDFGGPLPVGAVQLGWVGVAAAVGLAALVVA